ncbi:MAG TPA: DUF6030 family protein [Bryobacteraceae bacterium]|nr:DUF6030 family protein [Bryobacteraceae bacterium]
MQIPGMLSLALLFGTASFGQVLEIFDDPDKACALLESEGFPGREWTLRPYGLQCFTTRTKTEEVSGRAQAAPVDDSWPALEVVPQGSIAYAASGESLTRVSRLKLIVFLVPDQPNKVLMAEYERLATVLLTRIGLNVSDDLRKAIRNMLPWRRALRGANITFDPGPKPSSLLVLTVRDPRIRVETIPRVRD